MKTTNSVAIPLTVFLSSLVYFPNLAWSDTFGSGANTFDIEFVAIGNPGNAADTTGTPNPVGSVGHPYRIGKFEISEQMIDKANVTGGLGITKSTRGSNKPATLVTWNEAARFVNWLNTSEGYHPAYDLAAFDRNSTVIEGGFHIPEPVNENRARHRKARYFLPSVDEWYKAAYYDPAADVYLRLSHGERQRFRRTRLQ